MNWSNKAIKAAENQIYDTVISRNLLGMCIVNYFYNKGFDDHDIIHQMKNQDEIELTNSVINEINSEVKKAHTSYEFKRFSLSENLL